MWHGDYCTLSMESQSVSNDAIFNSLRENPKSHKTKVYIGRLIPTVWLSNTENVIFAEDPYVQEFLNVWISGKVHSHKLNTDACILIFKILRVSEFLLVQYVWCLRFFFSPHLWLNISHLIVTDVLCSFFLNATYINIKKTLPGTHLKNLKNPFAFGSRKRPIVSCRSKGQFHVVTFFLPVYYSPSNSRQISFAANSFSLYQKTKSSLKNDVILSRMIKVLRPCQRHFQYPSLSPSWDACVLFGA